MSAKEHLSYEATVLYCIGEESEAESGYLAYSSRAGTGLWLLGVFAI